MNLIKLPKIRVQDKEGQYDETLTCIQRDSFSKGIEMNQSDQIDFTATNDDSTSYQLLQNENYLIFNDQKYRIKQAERDDEAHDLKKTVSATHIWFDIQYIHQYDKLSGNHQVNANDLMSFVFDQNDLGNNGFTWEVIGSTDTVTVSDYGDISGLDCVNDCISKFNLVVVADNKHIKLITMDKWQHKTNKAFRYIHDTPTFKASIDTTELQNITKVFGKSGKPSSSTTGTARGTINTMEIGGAPVYSDPDDPTNEVQRLPNGTKWIMDSKITAGDSTWYRVSTNGWVNEKYVTFDKDGDVSPENHIITKVKGQGTIKVADDSTTDDSDNDTDTSIGNAEAKIYDSPFTPQTLIQNTLKDGTRWYIDAQVSEGAQGKTWYRVATNQWINSEDFDFSGDEDVRPKEEKKDNDDTACEDDHSTDYFAPFYVRDDKSIAEWGARPGPSITNDTIKDPDEMRRYALSQMKTEPEVSISLTYSGSDDFDIGDMVYCDIQPESFTTWVTVVNIKYNPLSYVKEYDLSLNSTPQTLADYELSIQTSLSNARNNNAISISNGIIARPWLTQKVGEV